MGKVAFLFLLTLFGCSRKMYNQNHLSVKIIEDTLFVSSSRDLKLQYIVDKYVKEGSIVKFENASFFISKPVLISVQDITFIGGGETRITFSGDGDMFTFQNANNVTFENIYFDCLNTNKNKGQYFLRCSKKKPSKGIVILDCTFSKKNANNGFNNILYLKPGCDNTRFVGNTINNLMGSKSGNGYGVLCVGCKHSIFSQNIMYGRESFGRHAFYLSAGAQNNIIEDNKLYGIPVAAISLAGKSTQLPTKNNIVRRNVIDGGASLHLNSGMINLFGNVHDNRIEANRILNSKSYGIINNATFGNGLERSSGNSFIANYFEGIYRAGIFLGGVKNITLKNNAFKDVSLVRVNKYGAIHVSTDINKNYSCDSVLMLGNKNKSGKRVLKLCKTRNSSVNIREE